MGFKSVMEFGPSPEAITCLSSEFLAVESPFSHLMDFLVQKGNGETNQCLYPLHQPNACVFRTAFSSKMIWLSCSSSVTQKKNRQNWIEPCYIYPCAINHHQRITNHLLCLLLTLSNCFCGVIFSIVSLEISSNFDLKKMFLPPE